MANNSKVSKTPPVGYKNPPKHTQFKPGKSGNDKGRPKGKIPSSQILAKLLGIKMTINTGGTEKTVTRQEALFLGLIRDALKGVPSARKQLFQLLHELEAGEKLSPAEPVIGPDDESLIKSYYENNPSVSQNSVKKAKSTVKIVKASPK